MNLLRAVWEESSTGYAGDLIENRQDCAHKVVAAVVCVFSVVVGEKRTRAVSS
jgi:hypothetical protein